MEKRPKRVRQLIITLTLIILGAGGMVWLIAGKQPVKRIKPPLLVPTVETLAVEAEDRRVVVDGEGTVVPLREIQLVPQVGGKVIWMSSALVNGGSFQGGEVLLRIDPTDYRLAVTLAQAKVKDSESKLRLAEEEMEAAREEWRLLYADREEEAGPPPPLVAREPQLQAARARLEADEAELQRARLNLKRTELKTPFDGRVSKKMVDLGQVVSTGQALAVLFSTEAAEISVPLEGRDLNWITVPGFTPETEAGSPAVILSQVSGREQRWNGRVVRAEGRLDERTRMINVVVRVDDPYGKKPPLVPGLFVTVGIQGRVLKQAFLLPRSALHGENLVWAVDHEEKIRFRRVEVARVQGDRVLIRGGLEERDRVVLTPLSEVTDGMQVKSIPLEGAGRS